jgi:adenylyltransferase/sulfurtransferase
MDLDFSETEIQRYARHILLPEVGGAGQAKLRAARVLVVGAGGLGSPLVLYLAAAGVGHIAVVDDDVVELSNLQRQIAHRTAGLGENKAHSAAHAVAALNPLVHVTPIAQRIDASNVMTLISGYDIVCDGSDNFRTRFLLADATYLSGTTLASAAVLRFEGQLSLFKPQSGSPCYRCLYSEAPPDGLVPSCSEAGVFGAVTGVMGTLLANEVLKEIMGIGQSLSGRLLIWDALSMQFRTIRFDRAPECALCGPAPRICDLSAHQATRP